MISKAVNQGALDNILGSAGSGNIQGETQQKLDILANDMLIQANESSGLLAAMASEELDTIHVIPEHLQQGDYLLLFDPLDGSSNIDVNVSVGTIFSIYRRVSQEGPGLLSDCLQKGMHQVAAGYVVYGSSTMLVYTTGHGVNGFTLDPSIGEFCLSHPDMRIPEQGFIYSVNEGNYIHFPQGIKQYIKYCQAYDETTSRPYNSRYIGSMVADFHRNLLKGGVFIYPATGKAPKGKLRLGYECNPMAFIVEQAGGKASDGKNRILELESTDLHQRTPVVLGSRLMVEKVESFLREFPDPGSF